MQEAEGLVLGKLDLREFFWLFRLDLGPFLSVLRRTRSIVTGVLVVLFMDAQWSGDPAGHAGCRVLEVLCRGSEARMAVQAMLEGAGYYAYSGSCRHNMGEWTRVPRDKRTCMVMGRFMQRVVHVVELPRSPVETVLGRTYGSMAGTYITGGAKAVSLFPSLTFAERKAWLPARCSGKLCKLVQARYPGWNVTQEGEPGEEVASMHRSVLDSLTRVVQYDPETGELLRVGAARQGSLLDVQSFRQQVIEQDMQVASAHPSIMASMNADGGAYDPGYWEWSRT